MEELYRIISDFHSLAEDCISGILTEDKIIKEKAEEMNEKLTKALKRLSDNAPPEGALPVIDANK